MTPKGFCLLSFVVYTINDGASILHKPSQRHRAPIRKIQKHPFTSLMDKNTTSPDENLIRATCATSRRRILQSFLVTAINTPLISSPALAFINPLNLKGTFWETGKLYKKSNFDNENLTDDPKLLMEVLRQAAKSISPGSDIDVTATEGRYAELSRMLRGGIISESRIRVTANALIDAIEDEQNMYLASECFRLFSIQFDTLDKIVELASNSKQSDDTTMNVLSLLGETEEALQAFINVLNDALPLNKS